MRIFVLGLALLLAAPGDAQAVDPPRDVAHPARLAVLHVPSGGVSINGVAYLASGAGPHPTLVICHGWPGNEKNLDLAQAVRRAGWNAVTFNYRGSWGSPGTFHFAQNPDDARAVLAYLRDPANAARLGIDTRRIALAGHSMGGWVTARVAATDPALLGAATISLGDLGRVGDQPRDKVLAAARDNAETLATTPEAMAAELIAGRDGFSVLRAAAGLKAVPLLVLTADDGLAGHSDALVAAIRAGGGTKVTTRHIATDHSWSDARLTLADQIVGWLATLNQGVSP